ncbi:MAG: hypothetical protein KC445_15970 [Anaerolineales bacterium]|nr:hypothetical protein [Anaerolineales bacterium]
MSVFVLANIGSRDVLLDGQQIFPARNTGAEIWEKYKEEPEQLRGRLSFPILEPSLKQILAEEGQIDQLVIFGTAQREDVEEKFRRTDTLYFAEILVRVFGEMFPALNAARSVFIQEINPSVYDEALEFYREELPRLRLPKTEETTVYLLPTAGPPACSLGLLVQGLVLFGEQCRVLYKRDEEKQPRALPIEARLQETFQRQTAVHLLHQYNFQAAAQACASAGIQRPLVTHLMTYATARLWFSFTEAAVALPQAILLANGTQRNSLEAARLELEALNAENPEALLRELFVNARIAWENGRWLDFLLRSVRFQQLVLPIVVAKMPADTFTPPNITDKLAMSGIAEIIISQMVTAVANKSPEQLVASQQKELSRLMQDSFNKDELRSLCFDLAINYENIAGDTLESQVISLIEYCQRRNQLFKLMQSIKVERSEKAKNYQGLFATDEITIQMVSALYRLSSLYSLYEQTILATGHSGVTEKILNQVYSDFQQGDPSFGPVDDMAIICGALGISSQNPFRIVKEMLVEELQK